MNTPFNPSNLIYLFLLKYPLNEMTKSVVPRYSLESQAFMFQYFLHKESSLVWERLFHVHKNFAEDFDFILQVSNLRYHGLINDEVKITEKGEAYLEGWLEKKKDFSNYLFRFFREKQKSVFLEETPFLKKKFLSEDDFIPVFLAYQNE